MTILTPTLTIQDPLLPAPEPGWCTQIKGYSTFFVLRSFCGWIQHQIIRRPKIPIKVGETFGSSAHCPMDKKLFSKPVGPITPEESNRLPCLPVDSFDVDALDHGVQGCPTLLQLYLDWIGDPCRADIRLWDWIPERFRRIVASRDDRTFSYWGPDRHTAPAEFRPAPFEVISKNQRSEWFEQQGIEINDPRYQDLLDERSLYFKPFLLKWSDVGPGQVNESRWELVEAEEKHLYDFTDSHRYQRFTAHGSFGVVSTSAFVAHGDYYKLPLAVAKMFRGKCTSEPQAVVDTNVTAIEAQIQAGADDVTRLRDAYSADAAFEKKELSENKKEALTALWEERLKAEGLGGEELRSLKYRKSRAIPRYKNELVSDLENDNQDEDSEELPDEDAISDDDEIVTDIDDIEPEDDEVDDDNEETESFSESESETSEGTCYVKDPRFSDDEDAAGPPEGHHHLVPMYEDNTRKTHDPYTHEDLEAARGVAKLKEKAGKATERIPVVIEMIFRNRTPEEALEQHGIKANPKTAQKWKERFMKEAEMFKVRPSGLPDADMTDEMLDEIKKGSAYVLVDLENGWKYHKLDTETYATLDAAIQALKESKIRAAWTESDVRKNTQKKRGGFIKNKEVRRLELQKIRDRFDERFKGAYVARDPGQWPGWRGLLAEEARREGEE